jgi:hypothetical protein
MRLVHEIEEIEVYPGDQQREGGCNQEYPPVGYPAHGAIPVGSRHLRLHGEGNNAKHDSNGKKNDDGDDENHEIFVPSENFLLVAGVAAGELGQATESTDECTFQTFCASRRFSWSSVSSSFCTS